MLTIVNYPGGKNAPGVYQTVINQIPPHRVYIEPFAGSAAIYRYKSLAALSYLIDVDSLAVTALQATVDVDQRRFRLRWPSPVLQPSADQPSRRPDSCGDSAVEYSSGESADARSLTGEANYTGSRVGRRSDLRFQGTDPEGESADNGRQRRSHRQLPAFVGGPAADSAGVVVICADATRWLKSYDWRGDEFVYADPPYLETVRRSRRQIYRHEIQTEEEHAAILDVLIALPCAVMISGYWSDFYGRRLAAWRTLRFQATTRGGKQAAECLWMNYPEPMELHDYSYLGRNNRERQDLKRMTERWQRKIEAMPRLRRLALLRALQVEPPSRFARPLSVSTSSPFTTS